MQNVLLLKIVIRTKPAQRYEIYKFSTLASTCIVIPQYFFYQHKQNLTQFVKVLLVKLSDMFHSSNFIRFFHRQSFTLYGMLLNFGILIEMSYEAYSILLSQVIATLIYHPCRVALPGLANWSASLE